MVTITGTYLGDLHSQAVHGPSGTVLDTDAPKDNQGRGESFSPTDLVATALATCVVTTWAIMARKHGVELDGIRYEITKEMSADAPRRIVRLAAQYWLPIRRDALPAGMLEEIAAKCPVHNSLSSAVEKPVTLHWAE